MAAEVVAVLAVRVADAVIERIAAGREFDLAFQDEFKASADGFAEAFMNFLRATQNNWRLDGAKTNPTASAPIATASSASSSLVMPQILTNTQRTVVLPVRGDGGLVHQQVGQRGCRVRRGHKVLTHENGVVPGGTQCECIVTATHT